MFTPNKQSGVALITALMIVALASIVSVTISTQLQLDIRRTGNIIAGDQARLYSLAAESLAQRYLSLDNVTIDDLSEEWAQPYIFPLEDGTLTANLTDLQACINLNTLVVSNNFDPLTRARLEQLFTNVSISPSLSQSIKDWIDGDLQTTIPDGAEDAYYTTLENPYRNANTNLQSISELKLIRGFEKQETIDATLNHICAFDIGVTTVSINVNTASLEVLSSLSSGMDPSIAQCLIDEREQTPFTDISKFMSLCSLGTVTPTINQKYLSVNTRYFMLETNVKIGDAQTKMFSIIRRDAGKINILSRSQGVY